MKIGISIASRYDVVDMRVGSRWMIERARATAVAGLDSLFVGDHHVTPKPYYQNTPMLSRLLAEWDDRPAGALYLLPFRHPVLLAEEIATMAAIAPGKFIMQCGLGYGDREFAAFGINPRQRPSRFEESLQIMRRLWAGETVSHAGRWSFDEAIINPTPSEPIEVWIAGRAKPAIKRAARLGDDWLAAPGLTPTAAQECLTHYLNSCESFGRGPGVRAIRRDIYIGDNQSEADRIGGRIVADGYRGFSPDAPIVGDPRKVAEVMGDFARMGFSDIIVRNLVSDQKEALACITRLNEVKQLLD